MKIIKKDGQTTIDGKYVQAFSLLPNQIKIYGQESTQTLNYHCNLDICINGLQRVRNGLLLTNEQKYERKTVKT